jgi:hypothetical protein
MRTKGERWREMLSTFRSPTKRKRVKKKNCSPISHLAHSAIKLHLEEGRGERIKKENSQAKI